MGYRYELGGEAETSARANQSITEQLPVAGLLILLLLIGQFNSVRRTAIILLTIPLGLIGVVAGLLIAQSYVGFMTLLGIVALAGIIINNGIVLIDRIRIEIDDNGLDPATCRRRGGAEPLPADPADKPRPRSPGYCRSGSAAGRCGNRWQIAIVFGLLGATVLTLGVVPVLYSLFFRVRFSRYGGLTREAPAGRKPSYILGNGPTVRGTRRKAWYRGGIASVRTVAQG